MRPLQRYEIFGKKSQKRSQKPNRCGRHKHQIKIDLTVIFFLLLVTMTQYNTTKSVLASLLLFITVQAIIASNLAKVFEESSKHYDSGVQQPIILETPINQVTVLEEVREPPRIQKAKKRRLNFDQSNKSFSSTPRKELFAEGSPVTPESHSIPSTNSRKSGFDFTYLIPPQKSSNADQERRRRCNVINDDAWLLSKESSKAKRTCFSQLEKVKYCDLEKYSVLDRVPQRLISVRTCAEAELTWFSSNGSYEDLFACAGDQHIDVVAGKGTNDHFVLTSTKCRYSYSNLLKKF